jgi:hypothetical protein
MPLRRRGTTLGWLEIARSVQTLEQASARARWQAGMAVFLPRILREQLPLYRDAIRQSRRLMRGVVSGKDGASLLGNEPYSSRLGSKFEMLCSYANEGDRQEIATVEFDALRRGKPVAENLWVKLAWLSFDADDPSMRFRFSFGIADYDDVAADYPRQKWAAQLAEAVFPESRIITSHRALQGQLRKILGVRAMDFLERIVYFNAPNGGAQFHHDVERSHLGVVFAQLTGRTAWLALAKPALVVQLREYLRSEQGRRELPTLVPKASQRQPLFSSAGNLRTLGKLLDAPDNPALEQILNRSPVFTRQLIERGYGFALEPGDVLLLPQADMQNCCWHSVFCLGDRTGQALSFAIRAR